MMRKSGALTLSAAGTLLVWALVIVTRDGVDVSQGVDGTFFLIVFGAALPVSSFAAFLVWAGELIRVERAGR